MKSMAQLEYHYGLKVRIYPSPLVKDMNPIYQSTFPINR